MTLQELREALLDAPAREWLLNEATITFPYPYLSEPLKLTGLITIYEYVSKNEKGWASVNNLPPELNHSKAFFINIRERINQFINNYKGVAASQIRQYWAPIEGLPQNQPQNLLAFNCPETSFLLETFSTQPALIQGAYGYLTNQLNGSFSNRHYFTGAMLAYEFQQQDATEILQRRKREKASLHKLRNEFEGYITGAEKDISEFLKKTKDDTQANSKAIQAFQTEKEESFTSWFENVVKEFSNFDETSRKKMLEQEELYRENLRFEKPAEHWNTRAKQLKNEGKSWLRWLGALIVIAASSLFCLLWLIPDGMLLNIFKGEASAIKWTIVYITFISFLAFGIKTLSKVTFSTFHLARDAEEREQLAYVYLALKQEGNVDDTERHLILQSLFSRSDTGLLKDDSSPAMPGNIMDKYVGSK